MAQVRLHNTVWREGDPPLVNGNPPLVPERVPEPERDPFPLLAAACGCFAGAALIANPRRGSMIDVAMGVLLAVLFLALRCCMLRILERNRETS
jgi:hypothetical protein